MNSGERVKGALFIAHTKSHGLSYLDSSYIPASELPCRENIIKVNIMTADTFFYAKGASVKLLQSSFDFEFEQPQHFHV